MTDMRNLESILATLASQKPATATPPQGQPGLPPPPYPPVQAAYQAPPPGVSYQAPPPGPSPYAYPQPTSSGSLDLSSIQPNGSANVSIQDAIAKAKAHAAQNGVTPYERPINYAANSRAAESGRYRSSRSRSPPPRRDAFRDSYNPYRDERREERGGGGSGGPGHDYGHHGHGRDNSYSPPRGRDRDRHAGTFSPRGGNGGGRQRSPMRGGSGGGGGDDNSEIMHIESSLVGLIIGRQGENMRRIENDSHCRVQFLSGSAPDDNFRQCKISGPPARRAEARAAITRIIEDSGMGAIARAGLDRGSGGRNREPQQQQGAGVTGLKEGEECMQIMVPDRTVGLIIGRGGETIRDLQERSGCHINIVGESKSVNGLRPVNLIGTREAANQAKELIMEIVDSDSRSGAGANPQQGGRGGGGGGGGGGSGGGGNFGGMRDAGSMGGGGGDKVTDSIYVPAEAVGMIIGKGGEAIRDMQNQTGCKINVSQSSGPGEIEREIGLVGSPDAINRAKQAIEDKVEAARQRSSGGGGGRGGGGGGGGGGGRGPRRDYDNPNYGQQQQRHSDSPQTHAGSAQAASAAPGGADNNGADPYAAYGGYNNYLALWYQAMQSQQAIQGQGGDGANPPPGTS